MQVFPKEVSNHLRHVSFAHSDLNNKYQNLPHTERCQQQQNSMQRADCRALNFLALSTDVITSVLFKQILVFKADQICFLNIHFNPKTKFLFMGNKVGGGC